MAITPTDLLQRIELELGASIQLLELKPSDIMNIVKHETLPTFSSYYPYFTLWGIDPETDKVKGRTNTFYINCPMEILGISKVLAENYMGLSGTPVTNIDMDPVTRQITADLSSYQLQPITFDFEPPNIIDVYPKMLLLGKFAVEIKCVHPDHLATIPLSIREDFYKLAILDVRKALYPIRYRFNNINTTFGTIEVFMDKLESAADDRENLLEKFRSNFYKNPKRRKLFVY